jgi:hypothetical protein
MVIKASTTKTTARNVPLRSEDDDDDRSNITASPEAGCKRDHNSKTTSGPVVCKEGVPIIHMKRIAKNASSIKRQRLSKSIDNIKNKLAAMEAELTSMLVEHTDKSMSDP